jgi:hypothetical protein
MEHYLTLGIQGKLEGYLRKDRFGRVYIDTCASEEEHLTHPLPPGQERRTCRKYLDEIFPIPKDLSQQVKISYEIHILPVRES